MTSDWRGQSWNGVQGGVAARWKQKGVAMEHATGLRVKTGLLWDALKVDSKKRFTAQAWQKIIEDVWNDMSKQMRVGLLFCNRHTFSVFDLLCFCCRFDCWLVLPRLRVPLTCTGVFLVWVRGWYARSREADSGDALTDWAFEYHQNQSHTHTQNKGSSCVSMQSRVWVDAPDTKALNGGTLSSRWHVTWPRHHVHMPPTSQLFLRVLPCFALFFIIVWSSLFQQRPTGSHSLPNYLHIKQGSPQRRRP